MSICLFCEQAYALYERNNTNMYDIIIIGGGPAGLTAALYALRAEKSVLVLEGSGFGGQIVYTPKVENFPGTLSMSGAEFADKLVEQVLSVGGEVEFEKVVAVEDGEVKKVVTDSGEYTAKSIIIATGVKNRPLGVDGEEKLIGRGLSFCAVCDGAFYKGKTVAVVGGGNTAIEDALYLSAMAEKVYLIHRRQEFRAEPKLVKEIKEKSNIELVLDSTVSGFIKDEKLKGIEVTNKVTLEKRELSIDGIFVAVGQIPQNKMFEGVVDLDEYGYVIADEDCKTSAEGIYVAGDCRTKSVRQLTTAVSDGTVAAIAACE